MKEAMNQYFSLRKEIAEEGLDFLFKTPFDEDVESLIYIGEVDEDEYISWQPVEKDFYDFNSLEEDLGVRIHPSVIEYFNSYYFADLDGFIKDHYIKLESVLQKADIDSYSNTLKGYKNNHDNKLENIPLGIEGNGLNVVVDNEDGSVKLEDFERNSFEVISESIELLITSLRLKR
ncbi:SecY interacting protein Syd [Paenibacillus odorifer]|uniref:SecY interacting protein Syd n=2 Tax=Paenibacillus TaxID=44249 RepID=A0ABX3GJ97_9BACL|nr:SecY interacting protein Syd [Paenibacillus odorifer]OMD18385.1 SecY interacting protein Syd [Paenibacillus odorifer]OMD58796.1 SecY interacting protein Syd [Paenibacillus odorifer]